MKPVYYFLFFMTLTTDLSAQPVASAQPNEINNRLLVVSGGGARGAWGVGIANMLDSTGKRYAHVVGTSTGSLMAPLILLRKFDDLNRAYTSVTQKSIFNVNPFKKDGSIRFLNAIFRLCKPSLGTTENLRDLIHQFLTQADYQQIRTQSPGLDFTVSVVNFRTLESAYRSASQYGYDEMVNWIWASANEPVFMSPYTTVDSLTGQTDYWFDGGVRNVIPIRQGLQIAYDRHYPAVDVIVNGKANGDEPASTWPNASKPSLLQTVMRTFNTYGSGTREMNITIGRLVQRLMQPTSAQPDSLVEEDAQEPGLTLTFYFMPDDLYNLLSNELLFDKDIMTQLLLAGKNGRYVQPERAVTTQPEVSPALTTAPAQGSYSFKLSRSAVRQLLNDLKP